MKSPMQVKSLASLFKILKNEKEFRIQIFSLEAVEIFEFLLSEEKFFF